MAITGKYSGGYQIIDLKGFNLGSGYITESDIIEKLETAKLGEKPVYITHYEDALNWFFGPVLVNYQPDSAKFLAHSVTDDGDISAILEIYDDGDDGWVAQVTEL